MPFFILGLHFILVCAAPSILFVVLRAPVSGINTQNQAMRTSRIFTFTLYIYSEQQTAALRNILSHMTAPNRKVFFFLIGKQKPQAQNLTLN